MDTLSYYYVISNHIVEYYIKYMFDTSQITNLLVLLLSSISITDGTAFTGSEMEGLRNYYYYYYYRLPPGTNRLLLGTNLVRLNLVIKQQIKQQYN